MTTIPLDWKEFLQALLSRNTRFLLIGAHALAFHVEARLTEDLDVFIEPTEENGSRVLLALAYFGFTAVGANAADFAATNRVFMIGVKPWRIDILTGIDGVTFEEAWASREQVNFHGITLQVIGKAALLKNKKASNRKKDQVDVAMLEASED